MWFYESATGRMLKDSTFKWYGYSGKGEGRNNPAMSDVHEIGPIPKGRYFFGTPQDHPRLGKYVMSISPHPETETFGRAGFFLHGNNAENNASHGCIIKSPQSAREMIGESGDIELTVV